MPKVTLRPFGRFRSLTGAAEFAVELEEGGTVRDLLATVSHGLDGDLKESLLDPSTGRPKPWVVIFVNEENIAHLKGLETELRDGDEVTILQDIAGG